MRSTNKVFQHLWNSGAPSSVGNEVELPGQEIVSEAENNFDCWLTQHESYSPNESDDSSEDSSIVFSEALAAWFVESNVSTDAPTVSLGSGEYVHYGLRDCLTDFLRLHKVNTILFNFTF